MHSNREAMQIAISINNRMHQMHLTAIEVFIKVRYATIDTISNSIHQCLMYVPLQL